MKALSRYVAAITGHIAGCACERCADARVAALAEHGHRMVLESFGVPPEAVLAALGERIAEGDGQLEITVVSSTRFGMPWVGSDEQGTQTLTRRQARTAQMIVEGMTRSQIAEAMGMSAKTFDTHRGNAMRRMRCANEVQLLRLAIINGWVRL